MRKKNYNELVFHKESIWKNVFVFYWSIYYSRDLPGLS